MPFDISRHPETALRKDIEALERKLVASRQPAAFRTIFTTEHAFDAGMAGFDGPCEPGIDGGFAVHFDGRGSIPSVVINGSDGQIEVCGIEAIRQLTSALMSAEQMAARMADQARAA